MNERNKTLQFNKNPMQTVLRRNRKKGLRIGYLVSALRGFYLNSIETGATAALLAEMLSSDLNFKDTSSAIESFDFLINEGDRSSYTILLPYLLEIEDQETYESSIRKQFFGVEYFIRQGKNLYEFLHYIKEGKELILTKEDLERGILAWDLGRLVGLVRAARETGYIDKEQAWKYICKASKQSRKIFRSEDEIDKSFVIGQAMKTNSNTEWEELIHFYRLIKNR